MSAAQIVRSLQLRSVEQYTYNTSYNRVSFQIEPTGLSTDMSQSYLKLRLSLTDIGTALEPHAPILLNQADFDDLLAKKLVVSFGHEGTSYSPACLISLARLRAKGTGELLEEIQFANVLSQYLFQICNNFETLGASSLTTGSAMQTSGHASGLMESLSTFLQPNTEVQIMLRDIFGLCRHTNFDLSKTGGLIMEFELEQTHNLFQTTTAYTVRQIDSSDNGLAMLPEYNASGQLVYGQNPETHSCGALTTGQLEPQAGKPSFYNNVLITDELNDGQLIQVPRDGWLWPGELFTAINQLITPDEGGISYLRMQTAALGGRDLTAAEMTACKIVAGNYIKLTFELTDTNPLGSRARKPFVCVSVINSVSPTGEEEVSIGLNGIYYDVEAWTGYTLTLNRVEFMDVYPHAEASDYGTPNDFMILEPVIDDTDGFITGDSIFLNGLQLNNLALMGVVDASDNHIFTPTDNSFDLYIQNIDASGIIITYDRVTADGTNSRRVFSNQFTRLSAAGAKTKILSIGEVDASGFYPVVFENFLLNDRSGLQIGHVIHPGTAGNPEMEEFSTTVGVAGQRYRLYICNCQQPRFEIEPNTKYSFSIDQIQIVLVQETMTVPMTPAYSAWSVEVAMIESDQQQFSRQWIITAPNTYNAYFLTPDYQVGGGGGGSLVSSARGIANYRISVNNVSNTNRVVAVQDVTSQSPSSLHFDKLITTFQNSEYVQRSLTGLHNVSDSHLPVIALPIKLYSGVVGGQYQMLPNTLGATIQTDLYGSPKTIDNTIKKGVIMCFKQAIRSLATGGMGEIV